MQSIQKFLFKYRSKIAEVNYRDNAILDISFDELKEL